MDPLRSLVSDLTEQASAIKTKFIVTEDKKEERRQLLTAGKSAEAAAVKIVEVDFATELKPLLGTLPAYRESNREFARKLTATLDRAPALPTPELNERLERFKQHVRDYVAGFSGGARLALSSRHDFDSDHACLSPHQHGCPSEHCCRANCSPRPST